MIRWKYAVPRLAIFGALALAVYLGLNPLVRWGIETFSAQVLATQVDIERLNTSLRATEIEIHDLAVADPDHPQRDLVRAAEVKLALDRDALLERKLVVRQAAIRGLQLHAAREFAAAPVERWQLPPADEKLREAANQWTRALTTSLGKELEAEIDQLESVQLAQNLLEQWPAQYDAVESQVRDVRNRIEMIREMFQAKPADLASGVTHVRQTLAEIETLQQKLVELTEQIDTLPERALADRDEIVAAGRRDAQSLRERFEVVSLDEQGLTQLLLGQEVGDRVLAAADWVRWVRAHLPEDEAEPDNRNRGLNILFAGRSEKPRLLIESMLLDGETTISGRPYHFAATATGLTTEPAAYACPAVITATLTGERTVELHAVLDRRNQVPVDRIVINCPQITLPTTRLGSDDTVCLALSPGNTHLWVGLTLSEDQLDGQMLIKQTGVASCCGILRHLRF